MQIFRNNWQMLIYVTASWFRDSLWRWLCRHSQGLRKTAWWGRLCGVRPQGRWLRGCWLELWAKPHGLSWAMWKGSTTPYTSISIGLFAGVALAGISDSRASRLGIWCRKSVAAELTRARLWERFRFVEYWCVSMDKFLDTLIPQSWNSASNAKSAATTMRPVIETRAVCSVSTRKKVALIPQKVRKEKMKADLCQSEYGARKTPMSWSSCKFDSHMCFLYIWSTKDKFADFLLI